MLLILRPQTDPYFNLAAEEYLLKNMKEDCFMLWQNDPAIIVGKHQNTLAEINYSFAKKNNIPVVRRVSGGGTVFHDLGNLNFTFISSGEKEKLVNFRKFTQPIIEILNQMGVPAMFEGKNDLRVKGLKISGNAEHVFKNKVLHHGTLLFAADLDYLNQAIKSVPERFKDKAVQSARSTVANITDFLDTEISLVEFKEKIISFIKATNTGVTEYSLSDEDIFEINKLVQEKYKTWKWNFGYSPAYVFETKLSLYKQTIHIEIFVKNGIIENLKVKEIAYAELDFLKKIFVGRLHTFDDLMEIFKKYKKDLKEKGLNPEMLIDSMF